MPHTWRLLVLGKPKNRKCTDSNFTLTREAYLLNSSIRFERFLVFQSSRAKANASFYFNTSAQRFALVSAFLRYRAQRLGICSFAAAKVQKIFDIYKKICTFDADFMCYVWCVMCLRAGRDICTQQKSGKPHIGFTAWILIRISL